MRRPSATLFAEAEKIAAMWNARQLYVRWITELSQRKVKLANCFYLVVVFSPFR